MQPVNNGTILVVEEPKDVMSMEKVREYRGCLYVLHGVLSPMEGTGPEDINIAPLIKRLHDDEVKEVIIATNATTEGEATAMYLSRLIRNQQVSRLLDLLTDYPLAATSNMLTKSLCLKAVEGRRELRPAVF